MISDGNELIGVKVIEMKNLIFKDVLKKYKLENNTVNELQRVYSSPTYPIDSKIYSDEGSVNIEHGSQGGTHWTCFIVKDKFSY